MLDSTAQCIEYLYRDQGKLTIVKMWLVQPVADHSRFRSFGVTVERHPPHEEPMIRTSPLSRRGSGYTQERDNLR